MSGSCFPALCTARRWYPLPPQYVIKRFCLRSVVCLWRPHSPFTHRPVGYIEHFPLKNASGDRPHRPGVTVASSWNHNIKYRDDVTSHSKRCVSSGLSGGRYGAHIQPRLPGDLRSKISCAWRVDVTLLPNSPVCSQESYFCPLFSFRFRCPRCARL